MIAKKIVILGGGISAWSAAALLRKQLPKKLITIQLIEDDRGDHAIAESSRSQLLDFHELIGLNEKKILLETTTGFSLGLEFNQWANSNQSYFMAEGAYGLPYKQVDFQTLYLKGLELGNMHSFDSYSINAAAGKLQRFGHPVPDEKSIYSLIKYGLNFSVSEYVQVLKKHAIALGVDLIESNCVDVNISSEKGHIESIILSNGQVESADFYIDCTGEASVLLDKALGVVDAAHSMSYMYDRVLVGKKMAGTTVKPSSSLMLENEGFFKSFVTESEEFIYYYFSSEFISELDAKRKFSDMGLLLLCEQRFNYQRKEKFWEKNCLALGEAAMSIPDIIVSPMFLMRNALVRFLDFTANFMDVESVRCEYNRLTAIEYERLCELNELSFYLGRENSSLLEDYFSTNDLSQLAKHKLGLFSKMARHASLELDFLSPLEWASFFIGNGVIPNTYDTSVDLIDIKDIKSFLNNIFSATSEYASKMPLYVSYINKLDK